MTRSLGPASFTTTLFASNIRHPIDVNRDVRYELINLSEPTNNAGVELLGTWRRSPFSITGTYTYVHSREGVGVLRSDVPLTPRQSAGLVGMWEREGRGRVGLEAYLTGPQRLEDNPYRSESLPYVLYGALVERRIGRVRVFVNAEDLGNVRQSRWGRLIRPFPAADGRWTVDAWAPLDGRVVNGGIRVAF